MQNAKKDVYYIEVVGRALDVLEVFIHEDEAQLTLKEISKRLNQSANTSFRLLYTLAEHGYVVKTNKKYELGSKLLDLTNAKLRNPDLISIAGPYMEALRERFRETVNLGVIMEGQIRYIDVKASPERFRLAETIGGSDPLHCTGLGKAHLAFLPLTEARQLLRTYGMPRITQHTITSLSGMKTELERIRERGFAVDREESMLGGFCVAAPILDGHNRPVAAISIAGPNVRFNSAHLTAASTALLETTAEVARKLKNASAVISRVPRANQPAQQTTARRRERPHVDRRACAHRKIHPSADRRGWRIAGADRRRVGH